MSTLIIQHKPEYLVFLLQHLQLLQVVLQDMLPDPSTAYYRSVTGGTGSVVYMHAPVYLPDGARVKSVEAYIYDGDANFSLGVDLYRQTYFSNSSLSLANSSTSTDAGWQTVSATGLDILNR